jgi:hypothetical protein
LRIGAPEPGATQALVSPRLGQLGDPPPELEVDPRGDAIIPWESDTRDATSVKVEVARRRAGQPFAAPLTVETTYPGGSVNSAIGSTGEAIVAWDSLTTPDEAVIARGATGPFGPAAVVDPARDYAAAPVVAIDSRGHAIAIWQDLGPANQTNSIPSTPLLFATTH